jgi:hypothetical protein
VMRWVSFLLCAKHSEAGIFSVFVCDIRAPVLGLSPFLDIGYPPSGPLAREDALGNAAG